MLLVEHCPQASTWFKDPDANPKLAAKFNNMKNADFKKRLERKKAEAVVKKAKRMAKAKDGKKRVRHHSPDESAAEEGEPGPSKKKGKMVIYDSDDVDEST